jgi:hypothetical protein
MMHTRTLAILVIATATACSSKGTDTASDAAGPDGPDAAVPTTGSDAGAGDLTLDVGDAIEAAPEKPTCSNATCAADGVTPICDVNAGVCRACQAAGECVARDKDLHGCESGQCYACTQSSECTDSSAKPICETHACRGCQAAAECVARDKGLHGCESGQCYPCTQNSECADSPAQPICDTHACRGCHGDAECGGPGICLPDGQCATDAGIIYVEFSALGCPGGDGSSDRPFCALADAVAAVDDAKTVIVLRGPANDPLTFKKPVAPATVPSLVLIGRRNAAGEDASIPFSDATGIDLEGAELSVRDVIVLGSGASTSGAGVRVSSEGKLRLDHVTVSSTAGVGINVVGASITMDRCLVEKTGFGGLVTFDAQYDVSNSIFASNGYGVKIGSARPGSRFWFDTIVNSTGGAMYCDAATVTVTECLIEGVVATCTTTNTLTAPPNVYAASNLPPATPCATPPASYPDHDFAGAARMPPLTCGAL